MAAQAERNSGIPLDARKQARLAAILSRLASPYEHERAAAGLLASAFVAKHDLMWPQVAQCLQPRPDAGVRIEKSAPDRRRGSAPEWRGYCRRRRSSSGQTLNFCT